MERRPQVSTHKYLHYWVDPVSSLSLLDKFEWILCGHFEMTDARRLIHVYPKNAQL